MPDATKVLVRKKKFYHLNGKNAFLYAVMIERFINVGQINLKEIHNCARKKNEPTKPKIDESSNKSKPKADSIEETEEAKSEEEPNNPKLMMEPNVARPVELSCSLELTMPMPTSSNTMKKSELSTMIDMWKLRHNQQQPYCRYKKLGEIYFS
ncbi:hypothetical protein J1N35_018835 [Gossypium stocksii]|uniref:Uncharacterized protein n=1 Tax=Gossypium stocksii TaxID=47602 RepID=A0A9D3VRY4_9ROSI|nr:hypothetical protein J1N35_018835 [Gossypium stocksii]